MPMNSLQLAAGAFCLSLSWLMLSCNNTPPAQQPGKHAATARKGTYGYDVVFLKQHTGNALQLSSADGQSRILLSAKYQGRVMTSTAAGDSGNSFGWLNYDLIAAKEKRKQFNPVGGEERFWMGPEGGQYSIYFKKNDSFNIAHWQVPGFIDTATYTIVQADSASVTFSASARFTNYSGTGFSVNIERKINLLTKEALEHVLHTTIPAGVQLVGFETVNTITNTGYADWTPGKGLLSVWLLGMFTPGPGTTVILPFRAVPGAASYITTDYFGSVPPARLHMADSVIYFSCDGNYRSKIGLSPRVAKPIAGAFDSQKNVLTILVPQVTENGLYVNSKWALQKEPYKGDAINAYNDGPLPDGSRMGPFFEVESSSAAMALQKSATSTYRQTTCHFQGDYPALQSLAKQLLGIDLTKIGK